MIRIGAVDGHGSDGPADDVELHNARRHAEPSLRHDSDNAQVRCPHVHIYPLTHHRQMHGFSRASGTTIRHVGQRGFREVMYRIVAPRDILSSWLVARAHAKHRTGILHVREVLQK